MAPKRQLEQDAQGNWTSRYNEHGKADHYAHAENYCLQAMVARRSMRFYLGQETGAVPAPKAALPG